MEYCRACGGYLGGAYACPGCAATARLTAERAGYAARAQYARTPSYDPPAAFPQQAQDQSSYPQPSPYDRSQGYDEGHGHGRYDDHLHAYSPTPGYDQRAQPQYAGLGAAHTADRNHAAGHGGQDGRPTDEWHLAGREAAGGTGFGTAAPRGPADPVALLQSPEPVTGAYPDDPAFTAGPDGTDAPADDAAGGWYADEENGAPAPRDTESRGRRAARRARPKHRTLKLVLGTATGLALAGGLVTVLPSEMTPTSHSAKDRPSEADGPPSDGATDTPVDGTPASDQDTGSVTAGDTGQAVQPAVAATHPPGEATHAPPTATHPAGTSTSPATPTRAPTPPPAPPQQHQPPKSCVLICWY